MDTSNTYNVIVIGGGPAGQKAAIQAAKVGEKVLVVERAEVGGECVQRGTIPSKTLHASAVQLASMRNRGNSFLSDKIGTDTEVNSLMNRLSEVLKGHQQFIGDQLERNNIELSKGRARFVSERELEITHTDGSTRNVRADLIFIATGSRPRKPPEIPIDHEHILDSDSILSMIYLPKTLMVVGAGVIACEFATIFQALGVQVTLMDRRDTPMGFLDPEICQRFVRQFEAAGGVFLPESHPAEIKVDPLGMVVAKLDSGDVVRADKAFIALGRTASVASLNLEAAGVELTERGFIAVDENCQSSTTGIYAMGDVIGPPALATASMEQGRRAARHALGLQTANQSNLMPVGIYTLPEIACVGMTEAQAIDAGENPIVGRSHFAEIARGQINGEHEGMLKLVCDSTGRKLLGAHVIGGNATELIHLAQLAMVGELGVDVFIDNIFNFPTMAESYRVAALDIAGSRPVAVPLAG